MKQALEFHVIGVPGWTRTNAAHELCAPVDALGRSLHDASEGYMAVARLIKCLPAMAFSQKYSRGAAIVSK